MNLRVPEKEPETRVRFSTSNPNGAPVPVDKDWRVKVSVPVSSKLFYHSGNPGLLAPLKKTDGVIFPYTPSITFTYSATYGSLKTTHNNYPAFYYEGSEVQAIQIAADFTVQNQQEGQYLLACIYFFRACTKMFYGSGANAGNPPPVVFLNGYGSDLLPNVPCVVTSFQQVLSNEIDYIEVPSVERDWSKINPETGDKYWPDGTSNSQGVGRVTRVPVVSQLQVGLQPVYSRDQMTKFNLQEFAAGKLINKGFL